MGVGLLMLVAVPVLFIAAIAAFLIWTIRKDDINKERSE